MIGPDLAQVAASLLGIVSAIQMLFRTLTTSKEADYDLPTKMAGRSMVFRIIVSKRLVELSIAYLLITFFCLIEEMIPLSSKAVFIYDLALIASFTLATAYLVKIMIDVHKFMMSSEY